MISFPKANKVVITHSGGLDSSTALILAVEYYGSDNVISVGYDYGQKQKVELQKAQELCNILKVQRYVLDLSILGDIVKKVSANISDSPISMPTIKDILADPQPSTYIPNRNMILLSITAAFAEANNCDYIFTGIQSTDQYAYWDTTPRFAEAMNNVLNQNRHKPIQIVAPFAHLSKKQEIEMLIERNKINLLQYTLTCYNPDDIGASCGNCPSCSERIKAFMDLGIKDPIDYQINIKWK